MSPDFFDLYECRHLCEDDVEGLKGFTVRDGGGNLANYLSVGALYDEQEHNARVYLVIDKETKEIAGYFALKAGYVAIHAKRKLFSKEFDSVPGVELANFAVNSSYIKNHGNRKGLGAAIFEYCILPTAKKAQEVIGIKFIYIFALPYLDLINRYKAYGFSRLNRLQEKNTHVLIRPRYDQGCIFMYQTL